MAPTLTSATPGSGDMQPGLADPPDAIEPVGPPPSPGPDESRSPQRPVVAAGSLAASEVAALLDVDPTVGLSAHEARRRGELAGLNELEPAEVPTVWFLLRDALTEPFVILLDVRRDRRGPPRRGP